MLDNDFIIRKNQSQSDLRALKIARRDERVSKQPTELKRKIIITMGRARRNQRDAIRKQRQAKRKHNRKDFYDDDITFHWRDARKSSSSTMTSTTQIRDTLQKEEDKSTTTLPEQTHKPKYQPSQTQPRKPMDRIERMRLKKQQQKARRKEKKAAKEAIMCHSK